MMHPRTCIVIAQGLPTLDNGLGVAMWSSLAIYCRRFGKVEYLCLSDESAALVPREAFPNVNFKLIPLVRHGHLRRFLTSIPSLLPACVMHMADNTLREFLFASLDERIPTSGEAWCIIENLAPSVFVVEIRRRYPGVRLVYRSHDITELAFLPFASTGFWPVRLAWRREVARIHELEDRTLGTVDRFWTITGADAEAYARLHARRSDGVFGVYIDIERYAGVAPGSWDRILYLGSSDLRKSHGLRAFLKNCWPAVRRANSRMEFLIGGAGTETFHDPAAGVHGLGYVQDELEFLGRGRILLNPQEAGSGIKLKSLTAMAAGKLLLSTSNGVSGIDGEHGRHFIVADSAADMLHVLESVWRDPDRAGIIAGAGRELVRSQYDLRMHDEQDRNFARLVDS